MYIKYNGFFVFVNKIGWSLSLIVVKSAAVFVEMYMFINILIFLFLRLVIFKRLLIKIVISGIVIVMLNIFVLSVKIFLFLNKRVWIIKIIVDVMIEVNSLNR